MIHLREGIEVDEARLAAICERHGIAELDAFGSVLRDDFAPDSDIDLLYTMRPGRSFGLGIVDAMDELAELFGRPVDLVPRERLHWVIRDEVLATARPVHVAA